MPDQTAIIPPPRVPWYRRIGGSPRYLVLLVAGILIVGGGAAFGLSELGDGDEAAQPTGGQAAPASDDQGGGVGDEGAGRQRPPVVPAEVKVAVLNGTTVPGLAQQIADSIAAEGFDVGTVANSADQEQQRAESVVLYSAGNEREARAVGRRLGITQRETIDPASQELAGDAVVVVIAGADLTQ